MSARTYFRSQLLFAIWGGAILCWHFLGLAGFFLTAFATIAFAAYVLVRFRLSWITFSGFHAAALALVMLHVSAPLGQRIEGHLAALVAVPFLLSALLFGLSSLMPSPVSRGAGGADAGSSSA